MKDIICSLSLKFANELYGFIMRIWWSQVGSTGYRLYHHIIFRIKHVGEIVKVASRFLVETKNNNHNYNVTPSTDDKPNQIVPLHLIVARKPKIAVFILQIYEERFRSRALQLYSWCIGRSLTRPECYLNMLLCIPVAHDRRPPTTTFAHFTIKMSASYFLSSWTKDLLDCDVANQITPRFFITQRIICTTTKLSKHC